MTTNNRYYIHGKRFILEDKIIEGGYLLIEQGVFKGHTMEVCHPTIPIIDYGDYTIAPGLVDTHIHGIGGYDVMDGTTEAIHRISENLLQCGVTNFLPTTLTGSQQQLVRAIQCIKEAKEEGTKGAQIEGAFMEGPYFSTSYKGAQNETYIREPSIAELEEWLETADHVKLKVGLAPDYPNSMAYIKKLTECGCHAAIGHTGATYDQCLEAVENGANIFIHTFNGMRGLHHREPGVAGAALLTKDTYAEVIADFEHVHPAVVQLLIRSKGMDYVCLVSDCMRAGCMPDGLYDLGGLQVHVKDGKALTDYGSLAGSTLQLIHAVKNIYSLGEVALHDAFKMASLIPAKSIGIDDRIGSIKENKEANFLIINEDFDIKAVFVKGLCRYE